MLKRSMFPAALLACTFLIHADDRNLLLNADFTFHSFAPHRTGQAVSFLAHAVPGWDTEEARDITVMRPSHIPENVLPQVTGNGILLAPGKKISQFFTYPEARLLAGDKVSFQVFVNQKAAGQVVARVKQMKIDSMDGEWSPKDFKLMDKRTFPKESRGELVTASSTQGSLNKAGSGLISLDGIAVVGKPGRNQKSSSSDINTVGVLLELENTGKEPAWIFAPSLVKGDKAKTATGELRSLATLYRHIPRVMRKLWKGEAIHIVLMGSSIDRGSANPPMYPYDENPLSKTFKQPLSDWTENSFSPKMLGRNDLVDHMAQSRHYYSYAGRLKRALMTRFDIPADKILINFMAADGSCIGEAHSALREYCELTVPPAPEKNGHRAGTTWEKLYPELFARPEGVRPDLVIFGSGANEKTDTPEEAALFEGAIRFMQRNYPGVEFLFCMFQNHGGYTPNPGDLQALSLIYGIPFVDFGHTFDLLVRHANRYALTPKDGHPQAAAHYLWFKQIEKAFEAAEPIMPGAPQAHLPRRMHNNSYSYEGDVVRHVPGSAAMIAPNAIVLDENTFNCWGNYQTGKDVPKPYFYINGKRLEHPVGMPRRPMTNIDSRNSMFRFGNLPPGERYVVELDAKDARFTGVDCKIPPHRTLVPAPKKELKPGESITMKLDGEFFSVAWQDREKGGRLKMELEGTPAIERATDMPFTLRSGKKVFLANRTAIRTSREGTYSLKLTAVDHAVSLLGVYCYSPNR